MEVVKTGPSIFKVMQAAVKPLAVSLKAIEKNTHAMTPEAQTEAARAEKVNQENEAKQIDILKDIKSNFAKGLKDSPIINFLKNNWGKIILGAAIWKMKLETFIDIKNGVVGLWNWFKDNPYLGLATAAGGILLFKLAGATITALSSALGTALGAAIALKWAGLLKGGGFPMTFGPLPKTFGAKVMTGIGWAGVAVILGKMIYDGFEGYHKAGEWNTSTFSSTLGAALGGTGDGSIMGSIGRGVAGAWLGFKLGALFGPHGAIAGLIVGGAIGAIAGFFGGNKVAEWLDGVGKGIADAWNDMGDWFSKKKSNYDAWAQDFGQRMAKASDEWMTNVFNSVWGWMKSIWDFGKKVVKDPKGSLKEFVAGFKKAENLQTGETDAAKRARESKIASEGGNVSGMKLNPKAVAEAARLNALRGNTGETSTLDSWKLSARRGLTNLKSHFPGDEKKAPKKTIVDNLAARPGDPGYPDKPFSIAPIAEAIKKKYSSVMDATNNAKAWLKGKFKLGKKGLENLILWVWNKEGVQSAPAFTSGFRGPDHPATKKNPASLHARGLAFDLRSKHLKRDGEFQRVSTALSDAFYPMFHGPNKDPRNFFEKAAARNNFNEHFHFQKAALGFHGTVNKATGFIVGESGPERVDVSPIVDPTSRMNAMNQMHAGAGGGGTVITTINNTNMAAPTQQSILINPVQRKEIVTV